MRVIKRIARFDHWISPAFPERLKLEEDIELNVLPLAGDELLNWQALARAHVYHVSAAKDEVPLKYQVNAAFLKRCPGLLCVSSGGAGHDPVDVAACTRAGVAVVNQIGGNAASVAEMALGLMLAVSRRIAESDRKLRSEICDTREALMGHDIGDKTLGIVGLGHAGTRTAALAKAFGMRVLAVDPNLGDAQIAERGALKTNLDDLLAQSDIVSLHCPRDSTTLGLFDVQRFFTMKKGAIFITTARGGVHDEAALYQALKAGHLSGAGLDVWTTEPPALNHPLLQLPNVVATFHTAGVSHEGRANVAALSAEQIVGLFRGNRPPRLVNPEVWSLFMNRFKTIFGD